MKYIYLKPFVIFKESSMMVHPEIDYSKYNLEIDGIDPMSVGSDKEGIKSIIDTKRRVAWVSDSDIEKAPKGFGIIKMYDLNNPNSDSGKVGMEKTKFLTNGNDRTWINYMTKFVDNEYLLYNKKYKKQAILAHKEFIKRGGFWNQTNPESDIYLARLMGYGEEYIVPYIRKYFPNFDVENYIKENPRKEALDIR